MTKGVDGATPHKGCSAREPLAIQPPPPALIVAVLKGCESSVEEDLQCKFLRFFSVCVVGRRYEALCWLPVRGSLLVTCLVVDVLCSVIAGISSEHSFHVIVKAR